MSRSTAYRDLEALPEWGWTRPALVGFVHSERRDLQRRIQRLEADKSRLALLVILLRDKCASNSFVPTEHLPPGPC